MFADRVKQSCTNSGTGIINLQPAATGFVSFAAGIPGSGARYAFYVVTNGTDWEYGIALLTPGSPDTLTRSYIIGSSNGGAAINIGTDTYTVFCGPPSLALGRRINSQAAAYTPLATDYNATISYTGSADRTYALPAAALLGPAFVIGFEHAGSGGVLTIDADGSETIDGVAGITLRPGQGVELTCTGAAWRVSNAKGWLPAGGIDFGGAILSNAQFNGPALGTLFGITPRRVPSAEMLGNLGFADTISAGDLRGSADRLLGLDASGIGVECSVSGGLALSGGVLSGLVPRGHIDGLTLSNNGSDANNDIDIAAGQAADDANAALLILSASLTKRLDAAWAVGSGNGGLDTGSKANSTTYHLWLIRRPDTGVVDALFSTSATAPTMPADYTQKRRIGAVLTDGSGNLRGFVQIGDDFIWTAPQATTASLSGTATLMSLVLPTGIKMLANLSLTINGQASSRYAWVSSPDQTDTAPSLTAAPGADIYNVGGAGAASTKLVWTNTSGQIRARADGVITTFVASVNGWRDARGRNL